MSLMSRIAIEDMTWEWLITWKMMGKLILNGPKVMCLKKYAIVRMFVMSNHILQMCSKGEVIEIQINRNRLLMREDIILINILIVNLSLKRLLYQYDPQKMKRKNRRRRKKKLSHLPQMRHVHQFFQQNNQSLTKLVVMMIYGLWRKERYTSYHHLSLNHNSFIDKKDIQKLMKKLDQYQLVGHNQNTNI